MYMYMYIYIYIYTYIYTRARPPRKPRISSRSIIVSSSYSSQVLSYVCFICIRSSSITVFIIICIIIIIITTIRRAPQEAAEFHSAEVELMDVVGTPGP